MGTLEALDSVDEVLGGYDAAADRWNFSFDSAFWKALRHAHSRGVRGQGQRVAIIDSGCDLALPRLRDRVDNVYNLVPPSDLGAPKHGTAVALLVSTVAPESRLDIYRVAHDDGTVDQYALVEAIEAATSSDATVLNLSLGYARPIGPGDRTSRDFQIDPETFKQDFCREDPPCHVCNAAAAAHEAGKLVFAAVGNSLIDIYCPARVIGVIAVGFQREEELHPEQDKRVVLGLPVMHESPSADLFIREVSGVLGSSFACPLFAGVGALGLGLDELSRYISSFATSAAPKMQHMRLDMAMGGPHAAPLEMVYALEEGYLKALGKLPHTHCSVQTRLNPDLSLVDPAACSTCGFFAEPLYVLAGYWMYATGRHDDALALLEAARDIAPWSAHANAYLAMAHHQNGNCAEAKRCYEMALELNPGNREWSTMLASLCNPRSERLAQEELELHKALEQAEQEGDNELACRSLSLLATCSVEAGDYERTLQYAQRRVQKAREAAIPSALSEALMHVGLAHEYLGDYQAAKESLEEAARGIEQLDPDAHVHLDDATARILLRFKDASEGLPLMEAVIDARLSQGERALAANTALIAGQLLLDIDNALTTRWLEHWGDLCRAAGSEYERQHQKLRFFAVMRARRTRPATAQ